MKIAYVLYPDFTALDSVGPYEVISRWPDAAYTEFGRVPRSAAVTSLGWVDLGDLECDHLAVVDLVPGPGRRLAGKGHLALAR